MMQHISSGRSFSWLAVMAAFAAVAMAQPAQAQYSAVTVNVTNRNAPFTFTNVSGSSATFSGTADVYFSANSGLLQEARLTLTADTTATATDQGSTLLQPFNSPGGLLDTITILGKDSSNNYTVNLLTVKFSGAALGVEESSTSPGALVNLEGQSGADTVVFSSSLFNFTGLNDQRFGLHFQDVTPGLAMGAGDFLRSFVASNFNGDFTARPAAVPEPATVGMISIGLVGLPGFLAWRRRRKEATV